MRLAAICMFLVLGVDGARAQPAPDRPPPDMPPPAAPGGPETLQRGPLFVSPMGEPFRAGPENPQPPILTWFALADADRDGRLSREEFVSQSLAFMRLRLDANGDGSATSTESTALWRREAPEMLTSETPAAPPGMRGPPRGGRPPGGGMPPGGGPPGGGPPGGGPPGGDMGMRGPPANFVPLTGVRVFGITNDGEPVMSCDLDLSRRVTVVEFEACASRRFAWLDANDDGFFALEESERAQAHASGRPPPGVPAMPRRP